MSIKRNLKHLYQRHTRGWSDDECWDMEHHLVKWINEHFKVYLKQAGDIVDLTYHRFEYGGREWTQLELMERVIDVTDILLDEDKYIASLGIEDEEEIMIQAKDELYGILKVIHFQLWW